MYADKLGYHNQATTVGAQIKTGPAGLFGIISTVTGGAVTIYDGTSTSDVRGTVTLASASDGAKRLVAMLAMPAIACGPNATRIGALGVTQA